MRILILNFLYCLTLYSCMAQTSDFRLNLQIITKERSRDSNSGIEKFVVENHRLNYSLAYQGGGNPPPKTQKQVKLSNLEIEKIKDLITKKNLYQNIATPKRSEFRTPYISTEVSFRVNKEQKSYQILLYNLSNKLAEDAVFQNIQDLRLLLKRYLK